MILAHSFEEFDLAKSWLTIGVSDGVHRGHQQILQRLTAGARAAGSTAIVMTFWPHPASVLTDREVKCLTMPDERASLLGALGVDVVISQTFNRELAGTPAADFIERLKQHLGFDHLLIGYDFALGKGREGNAARLTQIGKTLGYETDVIPALSDESGVISSTEIRKLVATGDVVEAATLLGHCYDLHGPVVHGDGRGKQLGFPTANIRYPEEKILPANGVYACRAWVEGQALISTVEDLELIDPSLSSERLVYRLFHEPGVRVFRASPLRAECSCSRANVEAMLKSFSQDDRDHMVEDGKISVTCEFCSANYEFAPADVGAKSS